VTSVPAASLYFRSDCEEDLDESSKRLVDLYLKKIDYSLSISMRKKSMREKSRAHDLIVWW